jgi:cell division protein FtsA
VIVLPPDREIVQTVSRCSSVDGQEKVLRPIGLFGSRLVYETHIITSTFSHIHNIMAAVTSAKLGVDSFVLSSVAACEALLYPEEKKLGVLLADIGESVTDIAIYIEGRLTFSAVVPVGGGQITRDIASAFKISESDAESLKTGWGSISIDDNGGDNRLKVDIAEVGTNVRKHVSSIELSEIIEPRLEGLFNSVRNELIKSGTYGLLAAGSVLCGGSSRLCGAAGMCARILRMPARVAVQTLVSINEPGSDSVEFATAAGLTLYAASNPNKPAFGFESGLQNMTNQLKSFLARFSGSD